MNKYGAAMAAALLASSAGAVEPYFSTNEGALRGYDPVAYFSAGKPVKGAAAISYAWQGATWHFASEENKAAFMQAPERYAPQYGGYCAFGVSQGYAPGTDPAAFTVVDGKLYLNYNPVVSQKWNADRAHFIELAEKNWPALKAN